MPKQTEWVGASSLAVATTQEEKHSPWLLSKIATFICRLDVARSASGSRFSARAPLSASHPLTRPITAWFKPVKPKEVFSTAALIIVSSAGTKAVALRQSTAATFAWWPKWEPARTGG